MKVTRCQDRIITDTRHEIADTRTTTEDTIHRLSCRGRGDSLIILPTPRPLLTPDSPRMTILSSLHLSTSTPVVHTTATCPAPARLRQRSRSPAEVTTTNILRCPRTRATTPWWDLSHLRTFLQEPPWTSHPCLYLVLRDQQDLGLRRFPMFVSTQ